MSREIGKRAELLGREYLEKKGFRILEQNWRSQYCEIDLIALDKNILVFVEVKYRSGTGFGLPQQFVDRAKQKHLQKAAEAYLQRSAHQGEIRFDILSILDRKDSSLRIEHLPDAFWPGY